MTERRFRHVPVVEDESSHRLWSRSATSSRHGSKSSSTTSATCSTTCRGASYLTDAAAQTQFRALERGRARRARVFVVGLLGTLLRAGEPRLGGLLRGLGARDVDLGRALGDAREHRRERRRPARARDRPERIPSGPRRLSTPSLGLDAHDARHQVADRRGVLGEDREVALRGARHERRRRPRSKRRLGRHDLDVQRRH